MNKAIIIGNVGADIELAYTKENVAITNISVATNDSFKDKDGNKQDDTQWHRVVVIGTRAENAKKYLKKGSKISVEGKIRTRKWSDKDNIDRWTTEILAQKIEYLDRKDKNNTTPEAQPAPPVDE